ncbi:hypothetical protein BH11ARM2_BH11ARM2_03780 [soil metagenome]
MRRTESELGPYLDGMAVSRRIQKAKRPEEWLNWGGFVLFIVVSTIWGYVPAFSVLFVTTAGQIWLTRRRFGAKDPSQLRKRYQYRPRRTRRIKVSPRRWDRRIYSASKKSSSASPTRQDAKQNYARSCSQGTRCPRPARMGTLTAEPPQNPSPISGCLVPDMGVGARVRVCLWKGCARAS